MNEAKLQKTNTMDNDEEFRAEMKRLQKEYADCYLSHWKLCVAGIGAGVLVSAVTKNHLYWAIGGITGTMLDVTYAMEDCKELRRRLDVYQRANIKEITIGKR